MFCLIIVASFVVMVVGLLTGIKETVEGDSGIYKNYMSGRRNQDFSIMVFKLWGS